MLLRMLSACAPCIGYWINPTAYSGQDQDPSDETIVGRSRRSDRSAIEHTVNTAQLYTFSNTQQLHILFWFIWTHHNFTLFQWLGVGFNSHPLNTLVDANGVCFFCCCAKWHQMMMKMMNRSESHAVMDRRSRNNTAGPGVEVHQIDKP